MKSFGTWVNGIIDPNQIKPADTPAGDGIPNLLKYAAGLEPETGYNETNLYTYAWEGSELVVTYYQATNTVGVGLSPIVAETLMDDWSNEGIVPVDTGAFDALGRAVMEVRLPCDDSTGFLRMGAIHY
ncbi:hypothetical protein PDESU_05301 [Pontiella desulfatans]|uniref:Uncharacterized protein n=1 Tax=Pontiella desulfatans TaxID=2750659 RepID=A0A6C2U9I5_PONDE|nr:hypothetical protein [Pontiella desulfatans]VGO16710.1 hypothetical protein PDESU_05301 [Pontiella desulfatans]